MGFMDYERLNQEDCQAGKVRFKEPWRTSVGLIHRINKPNGLIPYDRLKKTYVIDEFFVIIFWLTLIGEENGNDMAVTIPGYYGRSRRLVGVSVRLVFIQMHSMSQNKLELAFFVYEGRIMTVVTYDPMIQQKNHTGQV